MVVFSFPIIPLLLVSLKKIIIYIIFSTIVDVIEKR